MIRPPPRSPLQPPPFPYPTLFRSLSPPSAGLEIQLVDYPFRASRLGWRGDVGGGGLWLVATITHWSESVNTLVLHWLRGNVLFEPGPAPPCSRWVSYPTRCFYTPPLVRDMSQQCHRDWPTSPCRRGVLTLCLQRGFPPLTGFNLWSYNVLIVLL